MTPEEFIDRIEQSGVYPAADLSVLRDAAAGLNPEVTGERFATDLERQGWLTAYQRELLISGSAKPLVLGNYILLEEIGRGGMGVVLKARHRQLKRTVALKVIADDCATDEATIKRFQREIASAGGLDHPHIVTAHDAGEVNGTHFLVMEYVEGRTLAQVLKESGPPPLPVGVDWMIQTARGMAYAHARGVVHRDLKPGNLFLDRDGKVKIMDLGLARWLSETVGQVSSLTESHSMMGTMDYMAPEQAVDAKNAGKEADIYSLGMTMFHVLTGERPYPEDTLTKSILAHREKPIPKLGEHREHIPVELEMLFSRMAAKNPNYRSVSMDEIAGALERIKADVEGRPGWEKAREIRYRAGVAVENDSAAEAAEAATEAAASSEALEADDDDVSWEDGIGGEAVEAAGARRNRWLILAVAAVGIGLGLFLYFNPGLGEHRTGAPAGNDSEPLHLTRLDKISEAGVGEEYPWISPDGLSLYFQRHRRGQRPEIVWASRAEPGQPFTSPEVIASPAMYPALSADQLLLIANFGALRFQLGCLERASIEEPFSEPKKLPGWEDIHGVRRPWLSPDGLTLVCGRSVMKDGRATRGMEIIFSTRPDPNADWPPPQLLPVEADPLVFQRIDFPRMSADGLTLWGARGPHKLKDLLVATRSDRGAAFSRFRLVVIDGFAAVARQPLVVSRAGERFFSTAPTGDYNEFHLWSLRGNQAADPAAGGSDKVFYRMLFNGRNLDGWRQAGEHWTVEQGAIKRGSVASDDSLEWSRELPPEFDLRFEWKVGAKGGCRVDYGLGMFQITDDSDLSFVASGSLKGAKKNMLRSLHEKVEAPAEAANAIGQWNEARIYFRAGHLQHSLNGHAVVDLLLDSRDTVIRDALKANDRHVGARPWKLRIRPSMSRAFTGSAYLRNLRLRKL